MYYGTLALMLITLQSEKSGASLLLFLSRSRTLIENVIKVTQSCDNFSEALTDISTTRLVTYVCPSTYLDVPREC